MGSPARFSLCWNDVQSEIDLLTVDFARAGTVIEMASIADRVASGSPDKTVTAAAFRDKIGSGRKVAIQILEFFDRAGVTARHGDVRTVRRDKLDRFGSVDG